MSTFNSGPQGQAPSPAGRWWRWGPGRPKAALARDPFNDTAPVGARTVGAAATDPWWRWNPYRPTQGQIEARAQRAAYDKALRDDRREMQRRRRHDRHPILATLAILTFLVTAAAIGGVAFLGLAFQTGSFATAGAMIDHKIAGWRADMVGGAAGVAAQGGDALTAAGQSISSHAHQATHNGG